MLKLSMIVPMHFLQRLMVEELEVLGTYLCSVSMQPNYLIPLRAAVWPITITIYGENIQFKKFWY